MAEGAAVASDLVPPWHQDQGRHVPPTQNRPLMRFGLCWPFAANDMVAHARDIRVWRACKISWGGGGRLLCTWLHVVTC